MTIFQGKGDHVAMANRSRWNFRLLRSLLLCVAVVGSISIPVFAVACTEQESGKLLPSDIQASVGQGLDEGRRIYALPCGSWTAQAALRKGDISLRLVDEDGSPARNGTADVSMGLYRVLLARLLREHELGRSFGLSIMNYIELKERIAVAASTSTLWDARKGKPKAGYAAHLVRDLLNSQKLYRELDELFSQFGYRVYVESVEKVMLCPAGDIIAAGHRAAKLPCGGQIYFEAVEK
jgi:hypothetical protein